MPEQKEQPGDPSPQPEWKHDFSPGPSEEELKRFSEPEWRSKLPDIRMEEPGAGAVGGQELSPDQQRLIQDMLSERFFGRESSFGKFLKEIRNLRGLPEKERQENTERIRASYDELIHEQLDEVSELQDSEFQLHNPYPYDSRFGLEYFKNLEKQVDRTLRQAEVEIKRVAKQAQEQEGKATDVKSEGGETPKRATEPQEGERGFDEESIRWLRRLKRDVTWAKSNFRVVESLGPSMDFYYDGELQLKTVRTLHSKATMSDFEGMFSKELGGETGDVSIEGEGLRELAVGYQDDDVFWRLAIASAAQWDYDNPPQNYVEPGTKPKARNIVRSMPLKDTELRFIQKVFGREEKNWIKYVDRNGREWRVPPSVLNFYSSAETDGDMGDYRLKIEALLVLGARKKLEGPGVTDKTIDDLSEDVQVYVDKRKEGRHSPETRDIKQRIAESVVKSGILLDWGLMASGELGWHWEYKLIEMETDGELAGDNDGEQIRKQQEATATQLEKLRGYKPRKKGEVVLSEEKIKEDIRNRKIKKKQKDLGRALTEEELKAIKNEKIIPAEIEREKERTVYLTRVSKIGGIYGAFDVQTVMFWARHIVDYDAMSETRSSLIPPTIGEWRVEWQDHPPYWKPTEYPSGDTILTEVLGLVKGDEGRHFRNQETIRTGPGGEQLHFGDLHSAVLEFMNNEQWFFTTPFYNRHQGKDYFMTFPIFFPSDLAYLNFWRNVATAKQGEKSAKTTETLSVWEELLARKGDISGFKWRTISPQAVDWYRVNMDQTQRWLSLIVNAHQLNQQSLAEFEKFFEKPSTSSIKELAKRIRLGTRGFHTPRGVMEVSIIPFLITLSTISRHKLMDRKTWLKAEAVNAWEEEVAEWVNAALNLPGSKGLDTDAITPYGNNLALMIFAYATLVRRYAVAAADQMGEEVRQTTAHIKGKWRNVLRSRFTP